MDRPAPPEQNAVELGGLVEVGLARYRPILPPRVRRQFRAVVTFLLEVHPAALEWRETLRRAGEEPVADHVEAGDEGEPAGIDATLEVLLRGEPEIEGNEEAVMYWAEAAVLFLVEAPFAKAPTPDECRRALRRFVDLAFAALLGGLVGAWVRFRQRHAEMLGEEGGGEWFVRVAVLFERFDPLGRDQATFVHYFLLPRQVADVAKWQKTTIVVERAHVFAFLEKLSAFVEQEGPAIAREWPAPKAAPLTSSARWATTLSRIANDPRRPRRRPS